MGLEGYTYAAVADIQRLIGDLVEDRVFSPTTTPTLDQVEAELDNAAADLNRELDQVGYTVPVDETNYEIVYKYLASANAYGAAAVLLSTIPANVFNPDEEVEQSGETRAITYGNKFKSALKAIRENRLRAGRQCRLRLANLHVGSAVDDEGNTKLPIFTRGEDKYPGRPPSLIETDD